MDNQQKKILVVDDDKMLREMHVTIFEDEDYLVDSASNGRDAWNLILKNHYDLLATDMFMPVLNGFELILKCKEAYPTLKIILLSGGGKEIQAIHGEKQVKFLNHEIEINAFLKKPFDLDEMLSIVENILQ